MKSERNPVAGAAAPAVDGNWGGSGAVWPVETWLINRLMTLLGEPAVNVIFWDAREHYRCPHAAPVARIHFTERAAFWRILSNPTLHFGEGYAAGLIQIEGNLVACLDAIYRARGIQTRGGLLDRYVKRGLVRQRSNSIEQARDNIHHHYDLGNDFYQLWLDQEMAYTCAYFPVPDVSLERAQSAKMDHVARKLALRPGEEVVEAGCGWGALARHLARHYGVKVRAYNISPSQIAYAQKHARAEGLGDRILFIEDDYRNIEGACDAFVSVGMLEHVGKENYASFGAVIDSVLKDNGRGLIHSIGQPRPGLTDAWTEKHVFPGGYAPTLRQMMDIFEGPGFAVIDVENLRLHYAHTIKRWLERYDRHEEDVRRMFDESFVRTWRLYLAASIANFQTGALHLYQVLFARPDKNDLAWTRAALYRDLPLAD